MATPRQLELALRLKAAVEGLGQISDLIAEIESLGGQSEEVKAQAGALAAQLADLSRQAAVIEAFNQISEAAGESGNKLADLEAKSAAVRDEQARLQANLDALGQALTENGTASTQLGDAISRSTVEVKEGAAALQGLTTQARESDAATKQLAASQQTQAAEVSKAQSALTQSETALQRNQTSVAGLEAKLEAAKVAQRDLTNQVIASQAPSDALTARHERATDRVDQLAAQLEIARFRTGALSTEVQSNAAAVAAAESRYEQSAQATRQAGDAAQNLRLQLAASREELDKKKAALDQQRKALRETEDGERQLERAVREDEAALRKQAQALTDLQAKLEVAEQAHRKNTIQVERATNALKFAGIETDKLATEEQRVARETIEAKNAISQLEAELSEQRNTLRGTATETGRAADETRRLGNEQEAAARKTGGFSDSINGAFKRVVALGAAYIGLNEGKQVLQSILATGDQFEVFEKQLAATFGTAEAGQAAFQWVREFARDTPLELDQVLQSTLQLKNFGLDPLDGTLQSLVDQNSKLGGSAERLGRIITATGQAFAKGRLQGEEILQFAEAGVPIFDLLSQVTGKTTAEVLELATAGRLGRDVIRDLIKAMGDNAVGSSASQMETLSGRVSNAADNYQTFLNVVANNGPLELAKETVSDIGDALEDSDGAARAIGQTLVAVGNTILAVGNVIRAEFLRAKAQGQSFAAAMNSVFSVVALGLSKITFGDLSKQFAEAADVLSIRAKELVADAERDNARVAKAYEDAYIRLGNAVGAGVEAVKAANGEAAASADATASAQQRAATAAQQAAADREKAAQVEAEALAKVRQDAEALGLDYSRITTQISQDTATRIGALQSLAENGAASADILRAAFESVLSAAETQEDAAAIGEAVAGIERAGFDAAAALQLVSQRIAALPSAGGSVAGTVSGIQSIGSNARGAGAQVEALGRGVQQLPGVVQDAGEQIGTVAEQQQQGALAIYDQLNKQREADRKESRGATDQHVQNEQEKAESSEQSAERQERAAGGVAKAIADLVNGNRAVFAALSAEAEAVFDAMLKRTARVNVSVGRFLQEFAVGVRELQAEQAEQTAQAERQIERLNGVTTAGQQTLQTAESIRDSFAFLDQETLSNLNAAIDSTRTRMQALADESRATFNTLRDELDRLRGDEELIEQRRRDAQRTEIQANLDAAQRSGADRDTQNQLRDSLRLLDDIERELASQRAAAARQDAQSARAVATPARAATTAPASTQAAPVRRVEVTLNIGGSRIPVETSESNADALLDVLARAQAVAGL